MGVSQGFVKSVRRSRQIYTKHRFGGGFAAEPLPDVTLHEPWGASDAGSYAAGVGVSYDGMMQKNITILGLGPGDPALLTRGAWDALTSAVALYLRTARHPTVAALPPHVAYQSFDQLYEEADGFAAIYRRIVDTLLERAHAGDPVVYAVPGHPLVAEATTRLLLARSRDAGVQVRIIAGLSFIEPVCEALELDPLAPGMQLIDAFDLLPPEAADGPSWAELNGHAPYSAPLVPFPALATRPLLVCQIYNRRIASDVKLSLMERYPATHPVWLVRAAGVHAAQQVWQVPLFELDRQETIDHLTCAYLPPLAALDD
ncbi:MAG TPA: SAM-dependent methyltransferase, partial [Roseiflexaceae bacterium]|nr:SAM-dependent methyltransferase [Roseiflexaceae bacterium]